MSRYKLRLRFVRWIFKTAYYLPLESNTKMVLFSVKQALDKEIGGYIKTNKEK